jgi:DNA uptake protein ComE-like DNA-binding protein
MKIENGKLMLEDGGCGYPAPADDSQSSALHSPASIFHPRSSPTRRRGSVFIVALAITVILSAMLLVFAQEMRTELMTAGSRVSIVKADAIEQGAEQWVLGQIEANTTAMPSSDGTAATVTNSNPVDPTTIPAEAIQVGDGYFWLLHPDPTQDQTYGFGIVDESGKLNLNGASLDELSALPEIDSDQANLIYNWPSSTNSGGTAMAFESVENLLLADTGTEYNLPLLLYGYDLNHDGVMSQAETRAAHGAAVTDGVLNDSRGIFNYITVYSTNATPGTIGTTTGGVGRGGIVKRTIGLVNVNTAPAQVLACLPGMTADSAAQLVAARSSASLSSPTDISWVSSAGVGASITQYITGTSYQYSADIVAVSGDGRSFKRVRIVVDCRTSPAIIVYRKDLTNLGWPLPEEVRTSLRAGKGVPQDVTGQSNAQTAGGLQK